MANCVRLAARPQTPRVNKQQNDFGRSEKSNSFTAAAAAACTNDKQTHSRIRAADDKPAIERRAQDLYMPICVHMHKHL